MKKFKVTLFKMIKPKVYITKKDRERMRNTHTFTFTVFGLVCRIYFFKFLHLNTDKYSKRLDMIDKKPEILFFNPKEYETIFSSTSR